MKWQRVYSSTKPYEAEIVKDILEERGLSPIFINKKESATQIGYCEILLPNEEVLKGIKIINDDIPIK